MTFGSILRTSLLCAVFSLPCVAHAQTTDSQVWTFFTFNARFSSGLRLYAEAQPRYSDDNRGFNQLLLRPAVGYQVSKTVSLWLGYGWTPTLRPRFNNENRVFQQVLVENNFARFSMQNRTRLEERFIHGAGATSYRARHLVRLSRPFNTGSQWSVVASNELFVHLNTTPNGPQAGFDQMRPYLGISRNVDKHTRLEAGYMATFVNPPRNAPNRRQDTLVLIANYSL